MPFTESSALGFCGRQLSLMNFESEVRVKGEAQGWCFRLYTTSQLNNDENKPQGSWSISLAHRYWIMLTWSWFFTWSWCFQSPKVMIVILVRFLLLSLLLQCSSLLFFSCYYCMSCYFFFSCFLSFIIYCYYYYYILTQINYDNFYSFLHKTFIH